MTATTATTSMQIPTHRSLTYDDVLLRPGYSDIHPAETVLKTQFSRRIALGTPLVSAAMDSVTESRAAIVMAQHGGIGVLHKNLSAEDQAFEVEKVKKYESGMILDPITIGPKAPLSDVLALTQKFRISGVPVVDHEQRLIGIITNRDLRFETNFSQPVGEVMTAKNLVTSPEGTTLEQAKAILQKHRIEKLPVTDGEGRLKGLITIKDIEKAITFPHSNKDQYGRLRCAAAVGTGQVECERARALAGAHVDAIVVDTAHGHSAAVMDMVKSLKNDFPAIDIVAGNVATAQGCRDLIEAGADAIKVGIGPGSICTTRVVAGIGVPQMQAIMDCREVCHAEGVPFIADGGIKFSGDVVKGLAAGANCVMIGSLFAGTEESPGETILYQGRSYKVYRGMGSLSAMARGSKDRYAQREVAEASKLVPEGIEGQVPYRGRLADNIHQLLGGVRAGMGYVGAGNLPELWEKAQFVTITAAGLRENHPHDVMVTKEAPNYRLSQNYSQNYSQN